MFIQDINGIHADREEAIVHFTKAPKKNKLNTIKISRKPPKFIGPSLGGSSYYYAIRKPRSSDEFAATYRRLLRN